MIQCNCCGERFTLKGREQKGRVNTGFRRCLCNNEEDFTVRTEKLLP